MNPWSSISSYQCVAAGGGGAGGAAGAGADGGAGAVMSTGGFSCARRVDAAIASRNNPPGSLLAMHPPAAILTGPGFGVKSARAMTFNQTGLIWVVAAAALVLLMQGGFAAFEAGLTRPKNAASVALGKLTGTLVAGAALWVCGFAMIFGQSAAGLVGSSGFFLGGLDQQASRLALFCLQVAFAATAASVVS